MDRRSEQLLAAEYRATASIEFARQAGACQQPAAIFGARSAALPEVLIKVVSPGSNVLDAIEHHFRDIDQRNNHALERHDGAPFRGKETAKRLIEDWKLDGWFDRALPRFATTSAAPGTIS